MEREETTYPTLSNDTYEEWSRPVIETNPVQMARLTKSLVGRIHNHQPLKT